MDFSWISDVWSSQFLWGTALGVLLSGLTAKFASHFQRRDQKRTVKAFTSDLISNIQEYVKALEDHRERNRIIHYDFLSLIEVEISVWGRNREHMILISESDDRKQIRDFFTQVSTSITKIKAHLNAFEHAADGFENGLSSADFEIVSNKQNAALAEAHKHCEKLATFALNQDNLLSALDNRSRRLIG